jgi:hypothetical protein
VTEQVEAVVSAIVGGLIGGSMVLLIYFAYRPPRRSHGTQDLGVAEDGRSANGGPSQTEPESN